MILVDLQPGPRSSPNLNVQTIHVKPTEGVAIKAYADGTATPTASMNAGLQTFVASTTAGERRMRLRLRLRPGLYRVTVRALLPDESLSRPARGFVRVLKR